MAILSTKWNFERSLLLISINILIGEKMKKLFTLITLGSAACVSADQYNQSYGKEADSYPSYNGGSYYQDQTNDGNYYQQNQRQSSQSYYQQQSPKTQSYEQNQQDDSQRNQSY